MSRVPPALTDDSPVINISSKDGLRTPAYLQGVTVVGKKGEFCLSSVQVRVMMDGGSAIILLGHRDVQEAQRRDDTTWERIASPNPSSVRSIKGVGPDATNDVLYWVRGTLNLGGVRVVSHDIPVVSGHSTLILGNDFATSGRALIDYAPGFDREGLPFDGTLELRNEGLVAHSAKIPFLCGGHPRADDSPRVVASVCPSPADAAGEFAGA